MHYIISQSVRILRCFVVYSIMYQSLMYASQVPYKAMPDIRIPVSSGCIIPRSASHGNFQSIQHGAVGQSHGNLAGVVNDFSINVAAVAKPKRTCNNKLAIGVSMLLLAGMGVVTYLQVRITNQAQQIGANTGELTVEGDQLNVAAQQIAGSVAQFEASTAKFYAFIESLFNQTKTG